MVIGIVTFESRPEGYEETLTIARKGKVPGDVSAARNPGDDCLSVCLLR